MRTIQRLRRLERHIEVVRLVSGAQRGLKVLFADIQLAVQGKAVDRSGERTRAARLAISVARRTRDEVDILHAKQLAQCQVSARRVRPLEGVAVARADQEAAIARVLRDFRQLAQARHRDVAEE